MAASQTVQEPGELLRARQGDIALELVERQ